MKKQKVIKITKENRDEVVECFKSKRCILGIEFNSGYYYGFTGTGIAAIRPIDVDGCNYLEVVQNLSDLEEKPAKTFPRMMMVGDYKEGLKKMRVLFEDKSGKSTYPFLAVTEEQWNKSNYTPSFYRLAEEMPTPIKVTHDQVKEWVGGEFEIID